MYVYLYVVVYSKSSVSFVLSQDNFEAGFFIQSLVNDSFRCLDCLSGSNKDSVVFPINFGFLLGNIVMLLIDHDTKGSWHILGNACNFFILLQSWTKLLLEFLNVCHAGGWIFSIIATSTFFSFFFIFFSFNTFELLSTEKCVEIFLEIWSLCWMSLINNLSSGVKEHHMWHTSHLIDVTAVGFGSVVVDWPLPVLGVHMLHDCFCCLIDTNTDDLDLVTPFCTIVGKHCFIVLHWCLAWWTPCGPEINKPYLSRHVLEGNWIATSNWDDSSDWVVLATRLDDGLDLKRNAFATIDDLPCFGLECLDCWFAIWGELFLNLQQLLVIN